VTFLYVCWQRLFSQQLDSEWRLREKSIAGPFADAEGVVSAALGYFYAKGQVYGFMAAFDTVFHQGWGQATAPLLVSL